MAGDARALPTGTVTFLFTDVERSTHTVADVGDERYAELQDQHRELLREAFTAHSGVEVNTEGDAFFFAFATPSDAIAAVIDGQRALGEHSSLKVRMGLHTGEAIVRKGDYVGHEVHRAKRIADAGHGGQILVSRSTADLIGSKMSFRDLGAHWLKDIDEPERIFQLDADGLVHEFAPLRSREAFRHNLPPERTSFIGQDDERLVVRKHLTAHRLVTLTGVGGCGKTRLAIRVAEDALGDFSGGVFFIDLSNVTDPDALISTVAQACGLSGTGFGIQSVPLDEELRRRLAQDDVLLILDNCEHLIDACAELADNLLTSCPSLRVIATSREALEIEGEQAYTVPSLALPEGDDETSAAVELFCDRAAGVRPNFERTPTNNGAIAEICRRLDGVPLALELAAAQVAHLSPAQIAERLNDRFELLTGGRRRVQRQQTLGAALDWSHDLLSEPERVLLRRLAVFPGTFAIDAAESVGATDLGGSVLATLRSLVAKSLVVALDDGDGVRYRLLETVRIYAEEKLLAADESELARERHADHYTRLVDFDLVVRLEAGTTGPTVIEAHNLRSALVWKHRRGEAADLATLFVGCLPLWAGSFDEGARWAEASLAMQDQIPDVDLRAALLCVASWIASHQMRYEESAALAYEAIRLGRTLDEKPAWYPFACALRFIVTAGTATLTGDETSKRYADEQLQHLEGLISSAHPFMAGYCWQMIAMAHAGFGKTAEAIVALEEADASYPDDLMSRTNKAMGNGTLAGLLHVEGRFDESLAAAERAAAGRHLWRVLSGSTDRGYDVLRGAMKILALASVGRWSEAKEFAVDLTSGAEETTVSGAGPSVCSCLASVAWLRSDAERAARLFGHSETFGGLRPWMQAFDQLYRSKVREALGDETFERLLAEGAKMSQPDAIAYGIEGIDP